MELIRETLVSTQKYQAECLPQIVDWSTTILVVAQFDMATRWQDYSTVIRRLCPYIGSTMLIATFGPSMRWRHWRASRTRTLQGMWRLEPLTYCCILESQSDYCSSDLYQLIYGARGVFTLGHGLPRLGNCQESRNRHGPSYATRSWDHRGGGSQP